MWIWNVHAHLKSLHYPDSQEAISLYPDHGPFLVYIYPSVAVHCLGFWKFSPKLSGLSTSYLVYMTSQMGYRTILHIVMLQWFSAECWPRIGQLVSRISLQNYQPHQLHTRYTWPPRGDTEPYCISSCSSEFALNAGLWLVNWFSEVFSKTISPIDFILGIHDLLGEIQIAIAYRHAPSIFHRMRAPDWSIGLWNFSSKLLAPSTSYLVYTTF